MKVYHKIEEIRHGYSQRTHHEGTKGRKEKWIFGKIKEIRFTNGPLNQTLLGEEEEWAEKNHREPGTPTTALF